VDELRRVLVVGGASDTATVLKAVLEPRGTTVERTRGSQNPSWTPAGRAPEVVVIELDAEHDAEVAAARWNTSNRILIGSEAPDSIASDERFLAKPFQFPELVRVVEDLLNRAPAA
jgi:CheY-like chemotaxis protein